MSRYYYDFHIHSCLSPCGDNDMTPNNIAGMAMLNGMNIVALTDHNTALNTPAFIEAARRNSIIPVAGMELTTAEDIHMVCLFENPEAAMEFSGYINSRRTLIENRVDIFGDQLIMNGNDEITGTEKYFLSNATSVTVDEAPDIVEKYCGVCYPAHVDREANGIIATLGTFPEEPVFRFAEFNNNANIEPYRKCYPVLADKPCLVSSDAHYLENMREAQHLFELEGENEKEILESLFKKLRAGIGE